MSHFLELSLAVILNLFPTGDYLGESSSELKPGDHIVESAAAGPKNYGYRTQDGKVECKVRRFTLNTREQAQLNFDLLKANVKDQTRRRHQTLETVEETKRNRVVLIRQTRGQSRHLSIAPLRIHPRRIRECG